MLQVSTPENPAACSWKCWTFFCAYVNTRFKSELYPDNLGSLRSLAHFNSSSLEATAVFCQSKKTKVLTSTNTEIWTEIWLRPNQMWTAPVPLFVLGCMLCSVAASSGEKSLIAPWSKKWFPCGFCCEWLSWIYQQQSSTVKVRDRRWRKAPQRDNHSRFFIFILQFQL